MSTKAIQWKPEGPDSAIVARAINAGDIDRSKVQYDNFFTNTSSGKDLSEKYKRHNEKGERNLRRNFLALYDKIVLWKTNKPNPKNQSRKCVIFLNAYGRYQSHCHHHQEIQLNLNFVLFLVVKFSKAFLKKGNFPTRPQITSDIPEEHLKDGFIPGRDELYEEVVEEERAGNREEDLGDEDSLTVAGDQEEIDDIEEEEEYNKFVEEDEEVVVEEEPVQHIDDIMEGVSISQLDRQKGQCPIAWELLDPFIGLLDVEDPEYTEQIHNRKGCIIRTNIPQGANISSLEVQVGPSGKEVTFTMTLIKSRLKAEYTCGKKLARVRNVISAMEEPLTKRHSAIRKAAQKNGTKSEEVKKYTVKLHQSIEKTPRNPFGNWRKITSGASCSVVDLPVARSTFNYCFFFLKEDESIVLPTANEGGVLGYEVVESDDELNPTEQILRQAKETVRFGLHSAKKKKKKKKVRSSIASMAGSMHSMSIAASKRADTGNNSDFTEESYHSSLSDYDSNASKTDASEDKEESGAESDGFNFSSESDSDDSNSTRLSTRLLELSNKSRLDSMKRLVPIETRTVPGLAGLNSIVSINNGSGSGSIRSRVPLPSTRRVRGVAGYDPRIDDDDDDDDSFASAKSSSSGTSKSRSRHRRSKKDRDKK